MYLYTYFPKVGYPLPVTFSHENSEIKKCMFLENLRAKLGFPGGSVGNAGDLRSIPRLGRSPGEGNDNPLQDPCLVNPMDRGAWWANNP